MSIHESWNSMVLVYLGLTVVEKFNIRATIKDFVLLIPMKDDAMAFGIDNSRIITSQNFQPKSSFIFDVPFFFSFTIQHLRWLINTESEIYGFLVNRCPDS